MSTIRERFDLAHRAIRLYPSALTRGHGRTDHALVQMALTAAHIAAGGRGEAPRYEQQRTWSWKMEKVRGAILSAYRGRYVPKHMGPHPHGRGDHQTWLAVMYLGSIRKDRGDPSLSEVVDHTDLRHRTAREVLAAWRTDHLSDLASLTALDWFNLSGRGDVAIVELKRENEVVLGQRVALTRDGVWGVYTVTGIERQGHSLRVGLLVRRVEGSR